MPTTAGAVSIESVLWRNQASRQDPDSDAEVHSAPDTCPDRRLSTVIEVKTLRLGRVVDQAETAAGSELTIDGDRDEQLALAARSDRGAFEMLYLRHRLAVYRYLRSTSRTDDDAADLTATTFERALAGIGRYRTKGGGVLAWLFTIARNAAIDAHRRNKPVALDEALGLFASDTAGPDSAASEDRRELLREVARLPELQREALALRFAGGLTAREIGTVIGKSDAAAQKLLSRSIESLREAYRVDS